MKKALILVLLALFSAPSFGQDSKATKAALVTTDMAAFRGKLDRAFLEAGFDMQITVINVGEAPGTMPVLYFFGPLDRAFVYFISTKLLSSFDEPRKLGFRTVVFHSSGSTGKWTFDLQKSAPTCARDLCF